MKNTKKLAALTTVLIKLDSVGNGIDKLIAANNADYLETINFLKTIK